MLLDLDRFKEINDSLGHHHGDELLRQIGPRIAGVLRSSDTVARLGGDEFAVLLPDRARRRGRRRGRREDPRARSSEPFYVEGVELEVEASLGIAAYPEHGEDVDTLIQRADVAMYVAKGTRSGHELYDARPRRPARPARRSSATCAARWTTASWRSSTSRRSTC